MNSQKIIYCLLLLSISFPAFTQDLKHPTFSVCSLVSEKITGIVGESGIENLSESDRLHTGFFEVASAEEVEIPPVSNEPSISSSLRVTAHGHLLQMIDNTPFDVNIYTLSGVNVFAGKGETAYSRHLDAGFYLLVIERGNYRTTYKINLH